MVDGKQPKPRRQFSLLPGASDSKPAFLSLRQYPQAHFSAVIRSRPFQVKNQRNHISKLVQPDYSANQLRTQTKTAPTAQTDKPDEGVAVNRAPAQQHLLPGPDPHLGPRPPRVPRRVPTAHPTQKRSQQRGPEPEERIFDSARCVGQPPNAPRHD